MLNIPRIYPLKHKFQGLKNLYDLIWDWSLYITITLENPTFCFENGKQRPFLHTSYYAFKWYILTIFYLILILFSLSFYPYLKINKIWSLIFSKYNLLLGLPALTLSAGLDSKSDLTDSLYVCSILTDKRTFFVIGTTCINTERMVNTERRVR